MPANPITIELTHISDFNAHDAGISCTWSCNMNMKDHDPLALCSTHYIMINSQDNIVKFRWIPAGK